jgi:hypothetical protein
MLKTQVILLCLFAFSFTSNAQDKLTPKPPSGQIVSRYVIVYGSNSWNTSPSAIDSAFIVIRDKESKKLLQVQLEETAPDS